MLATALTSSLRLPVAHAGSVPVVSEEMGTAITSCFYAALLGCSLVHLSAHRPNVRATALYLAYRD